MNIQESGEMYLETILILSQSNSKVRAIDISEHMNYSKPSVSRALSILKKNEYINVEENGAITLTALGKEHAETIYERHTVLTEYLVSIGVDQETASNDACRIEHVISDKSFSAIKNSLNKTM